MGYETRAVDPKNSGCEASAHRAESGGAAKKPVAPEEKDAQSSSPSPAPPLDVCTDDLEKPIQRVCGLQARAQTYELQAPGRIYDMRDIPMPRMDGFELKAAAWVSRRHIFWARKIVIGKAREDSGINAALRQPYRDEPIAYPRWPALGNFGKPLPPTVLSALPPGAPPVVARPRVRDFYNAYKSGPLTPVDVAERFLRALEQAKPINAFVLSDAADIRAQAQASAARWKAEEPRSVLDGVLIAVKDEIDVAGFATMGGTSFLKKVAAEDATVIARLRAAGAIIVGKTVMHEIGISTNGFNANHGQVRNPYDLDYDTGGSSSGSAAAVAAGLVPLAIGADGGGSIRIPAAMNGVVGFKPTYARVSEHGALPLCTSVGHIGPLAASVEDAALVYAAMAGTDRLDPMTEDQPPVSLEGLGESNIAGLRVGVDRAWLAHSNGEVKKATEAVLQRLQGRGAVLVDVSVPDLEASRVAHIVTILWEMDKFSATHAPDVAAYGAAVQVSLAVGSSFTQAEYDWAQRVRRRAMENFMGVFDKVDVMVTPTSAVTAPHLGKFDPAVGYADVTSTVQTMRYAFAANLTGLPAISIPAGYDAHGLPIGVQVMGPAWSENRLLMVGGVIEADAPTQKRPKMFFDLLEKPYF